MRGIQVKAKQEAMDQAQMRFGYFALLSNEIKSSETALEIYRNKDVVEKAFGNIKQRLNGKRMLVSSEASLEGKLFVEFIALIFLSYLTKQMSEKNLFQKYTLQGLLDEIDLIECFEEPGKALYIGEILQKQRQIFDEMDIIPPNVVSSLWVAGNPGYKGRKTGTKEDTLTFLSKPKNKKAVELLKKGYKGTEVAKIVGVHLNTISKIKRYV